MPKNAGKYVTQFQASKLFGKAYGRRQTLQRKLAASPEQERGQWIIMCSRGTTFHPMSLFRLSVNLYKQRATRLRRPPEGTLESQEAPDLDWLLVTVAGWYRTKRFTQLVPFSDLLCSPYEF
jgi:hypothetical protein